MRSLARAEHFTLNLSRQSAKDGVGTCAERCALKLDVGHYTGSALQLLGLVDLVVRVFHVVF